MIKFYDSYFREADKVIHDTHEFLDVRNDIGKIDDKMYAIEQAYARPLSSFDRQIILQQAKELDQDLRKKYSMIDRMLDIANGLPKKVMPTMAGRNEDLAPEEYKALKQDRCGILCHVILKKGITKTVEEMIEGNYGDKSPNDD